MKTEACYYIPHAVNAKSVLQLVRPCVKIANMKVVKIFNHTFLVFSILIMDLDEHSLSIESFDKIEVSLSCVYHIFIIYIISFHFNIFFMEKDVFGKTLFLLLLLTMIEFVGYVFHSDSVPLNIKDEGYC